MFSHLLMALQAILLMLSIVLVCLQIAHLRKKK